MRKRLTYELGHKGSKEYDVHEDNVMYANSVIHAINKLGQLEDIEEELGIDLITLFKALKNEPHIALRRAIGYWQLKDLAGDDDLRTQDYGKTWALTKEELE